MNFLSRLFSISTDAESATNGPDQNEEGIFADILLIFLVVKPEK